MITLTKYNAKERCRTCLCKLLKDESDDIEDFVKTSPNKFIDINSSMELLEIINKYLSKDCEVYESNDPLYPRYICVECLRHLQTFDTFRNKALETAKKLYGVFNNNCNSTKIELNDKGLECKHNVVEHLTDGIKDDIFNLFLKESLMETEAIILDGSENNNDFISKDPDPFQNTQNVKNLKKSRVRNAKGKKYSLPNSKINSRKSKKLDYSEQTQSALHTNNWLSKQDESEYGEETLHWQDTFQSVDDSSDNEVLSNKILHPKKVKESKKSKSNLDYELRVKSRDNQMLDQEGLKENKILTSKTNTDVEKQSSDVIKTEVDSNGDDLSTDSDLDIKANTPSKLIKKKRHYILNSGRKKGLANKYKCDQCQHKFGHKLTLEAHIRKVHEGQKKAFRCQMCDKAYSFIGGLSTHIRDVHERKQDSYDCSVPGCDKKYSNLITLQRHVRFKHLNMETTHQYVCEQCGATFKQSSNLRYHMKTRHPTEEDLKRKELLPKDRLECEECKKSFHSQYTLKYHKLRVHADEKKFECKICGRRVAKQFMLDSHMLVHSDQKVACKFCGREFVRKYQVEAHIRAVHQKLKPFQCPHCSESFASRKTLRHHIYIHTGEKPYVCDICGQAYRQPTCLKNHRKIHNKLGTTNTASTGLSANRSFINNLVQSNNDNTLLESRI